jgi:NADH:ubiquinone oxidoreductase subunit D
MAQEHAYVFSSRKIIKYVQFQYVAQYIRVLYAELTRICKSFISGN